jgi:hypothetical protein
MKNLMIGLLLMLAGCAVSPAYAGDWDASGRWVDTTVDSDRRDSDQLQREIQEQRRRQEREQADRARQERWQQMMRCSQRGRAADFVTGGCL